MQDKEQNSTKTTLWMQEALIEAQKAYDQGEIPVGCVIIDTSNNQIIARGHNLCEYYNDPLAHAEFLGIQQALKIKKTKYLDTCLLYVTLEPCPFCAAALEKVRIGKIFFGAYDPKSGGIEHGPQIFKTSSAHHQPTIIGGIEEQSCALLLKDFFTSKR